jgi:hypothetical protein
MSSAPDPQAIARDATWLAQALDVASGQVRLVRMDRESYRAASFLDDRMLQQPRDARIVAWDRVQAAAGDRRDARWIFHIGHVGSTLVSRLLGELPGVLAIREPRFLRDMMELTPDRLDPVADAALALFSRTFAREETALVKATSFVSEIAPRVAGPQSRVLFIYATPRAYVPSILAGENSLIELQRLAESRAQRLASRGIAMPGQDRSDAHRAAAAWASEMTALEAAAERMPDAPIAWLDFDRALADMAGQLERLCAHFGFPASRQALEALASGSLMTRYSKALEHDYSPELRRELIAEATRDHRADIDDALVMLDRAAQESPLLARALARSSSEA